MAFEAVKVGHEVRHGVSTAVSLAGAVSESVNHVEAERASLLRNENADPVELALVESSRRTLRV